MSDEANFVAERLLWRFRKSGAEGSHTRPFALFEREVKKDVLQAACLPSDELPVLMCYFSPRRWTLVSTARLVVQTDAGMVVVPYGDLKDAVVSGRSLLDAGADKRNVAELTVIRRSGGSQVVRLEPGAPFIGLWNVLKAVATG